MDNLTASQRRKAMAAVKSKNTAPEKALRSIVHGLGFRYRLHQAELPGKPDLVLRRHRKVIFVHGCFWHGHSCKRGARHPRTNAEYWVNKVAKNRTRDRLNLTELKKQGWRTLVVWECEVGAPAKILKKIKSFLGAV